MDHGGQPDLGSNPYIGIDATGLSVVDALGADNWVIPVGTPFSVAMEFKLDGSFAPWLVGLPLEYTVTYTFDGRGVPDGPAQTKTGVTAAGQLTYGSPATKVDVPGNTLSAGTYELSAVVTFKGHPPMAAFIDLPVIEIF